jgi:hypothetical protein
VAIDTRDKRMSLLGLMKGFVRLFKNPTGAVDAGAREMLEFGYVGIAFSAPAVGAPRELFALSSRGNAVSAWSLSGTSPRALSKRNNSPEGRSSN